jgi:hypothetical protein
VASNNATSAAYRWNYGPITATYGSAQPVFQLSSMTPAYIVSSLTSSGVVTETPRVPVAPEHVSGPVSLNGLLPPPDSQVFNDAYQPQSRVVGGPGLLYSFPSDNRPYDGNSAMPIQGHPSPEALNALPSQQFHGTGQLDNINIAQSHSQQPFVFQGLPVSDPTNGIEFQQYQSSPDYTVSQDLYPCLPFDVLSFLRPCTTIYCTHIFREQETGNF